jgi:hypothetical protein
MALSEPVRVIAQTYHTLHSGFLSYAEGDWYETDDEDIFRNVLVCGFADVDRTADPAIRETFLATGQLPAKAKP